MCRGFGLCKHSPDRIDLKEPRCWAWTCEDCLPARQSVLIAQVRNGQPNKFLTLTMRWKKDQNPIATCTLMMKSWNKLLKRLRRYHEGEEVEAWWFVEATEKGAPHLHIALRMPFTPWRVIRKWWKEMTGAFRIWIETADGFEEKTRYITKYMGKEPHKFGNHKRYGHTRKYLIDWKGKEQHVPIFGEPRWTRIKGSIHEYKLALHYQGYLIDEIDGRHAVAYPLSYWSEQARGPPHAVLLAQQHRLLKAAYGERAYRA